MKKPEKEEISTLDSPLFELEIVDGHDGTLVFLPSRADFGSELDTMFQSFAGTVEHVIPLSAEESLEQYTWRCEEDENEKALARQNSMEVNPTPLPPPPLSPPPAPLFRAYRRQPPPSTRRPAAC